MGASDHSPGAGLGNAYFAEASDALLLFSPETGRVVEANAVAERLTGWSRQELIGRKIRAVFQEDVGLETALVEALKDAPFFHSREGFHLRRNQDLPPLPVNVTISRISSPSGPLSWVAVRDISERVAQFAEHKALTQQRRQAEKMEALGRLAGGMAHDFNNLLMAMKGFSQLARQAADPDSPLPGWLDHVVQSADRAQDLVEQFILFSRQEIPDAQPVDLAQAVRKALAELPEEKREHLKIETQLDSENRRVLGSPHQLDLLLKNLCRNACQAMEGQPGRLEIRLHLAPGALPPETIRQGGKGTGWMELEVSDNGPGIEEGVLDRIFEPFFTTKGLGSGSGLGLSIVHGIVQNHRGWIQVESRINTGTRFHVYLPLAPEEVQVPEPASAAPEKSQGRVLVVDDEVGVADIAAHFLRARGYETTICHNAAEALQQMRREPGGFDLVLTDQVMPQMTGTEMAREMHQYFPHLPLILMSGYPVELGADDLRDIGIQGFIRKPFSQSDLADLVHQVMSRKQV